MPQHHDSKRFAEAEDISIQLKSYILCLELINLNSYDEIDAKLGIKASTACCIFTKARDAAGNENLNDLLETLLPRTGRPPEVADGSQA